MWSADVLQLKGKSLRENLTVPIKNINNHTNLLMP